MVMEENPAELLLKTEQLGRDGWFELYFVNMISDWFVLFAARWCGSIFQNGAWTPRDTPGGQPSGAYVSGWGELAAGVQMDTQQLRHHLLRTTVQVSIVMF